MSVKLSKCSTAIFLCRSQTLVWISDLLPLEYTTGILTVWSCLLKPHTNRMPGNTHSTHCHTCLNIWLVVTRIQYRHLIAVRSSHCLSVLTVCQHEAYWIVSGFHAARLSDSQQKRVFSHHNTNGIKSTNNNLIQKSQPGSVQKPQCRRPYPWWRHCWRETSTAYVLQCGTIYQCNPKWSDENSCG